MTVAPLAPEPPAVAPLAPEPPAVELPAVELPAVELLSIDSVAAYLASRDELTPLIDASGVAVREVGDGNLNLVFIATDARGRCLVLKQSLPYVRGDHSWAVPQDRIRAEARGAAVASRLSPATAPGFHGLDEDRALVVYEDLSQWQVWRAALNEGRVSPGAGAALGRLVARTAFGTSVFGRDANEVRVDAASVVVPAMTRITEDLVFTEPFIEHEHNSWEPELDELVQSLREPALRDQVAQLKYAFLTRAEALIHGDLHTGSVFVPGPGLATPADPDAAAKAFDFEFSFYGPVGFDLGALFGNYLLAACRAVALGRPAEFTDWVLGLAVETWDAFEAELRALWPSRVDPALSDDFLEAWLAQTLSDAIGFGGLKAIRRVVGWAKVSDIESLPHEEKVEAAGAALRIAREWIERRHSIELGELFPAVGAR